MPIRNVTLRSSQTLIRRSTQVTDKIYSAGPHSHLPLIPDADQAVHAGARAVIEVPERPPQRARHGLVELHHKLRALHIGRAAVCRRPSAPCALPQACCAAQPSLHCRKPRCSTAGRLQQQHGRPMPEHAGWSH